VAAREANSAGWAASSPAMGGVVSGGGWRPAWLGNRGRAPSGQREENGRRNGRERERRGGSGGGGPRGHGANPAGLRSEARFELLSSARLRALFCMRWALPSWPDPT
jgi:hypothetical protein